METISVIAEILLKLAQAAPAIIKTVEDVMPLATDIKAVAAGDTTMFNFNDGTGACLFDMKVVFSNGEVRFARHVNVCRISHFHVSY